MTQIQNYTTLSYCPWTTTHFCYQLYSPWKHHWKSFSRTVFTAAVAASSTMSAPLKHYFFCRDFMTLEKLHLTVTDLAGMECVAALPPPSICQQLPCQVFTTGKEHVRLREEFGTVHFSTTQQTNLLCVCVACPAYHVSQCHFIKSSLVSNFHGHECYKKSITGTF
jgi:hypothetical protein